MKKLGLLFKETSANRIKNTFKDSSAIFIVKYSGLSSPDITTLRRALKKNKASLFVVKNSVAQRAFKDCGLQPLIKSIEGPCGLIFIKGEPIEASRALYDFSKRNEVLKLACGFFNDKVLETKDIESLAKLPSKEILRAQVVMTLNAPIAGFVMVLGATLRKFVYCLDQIRQKKEVK